MKKLTPEAFGRWHTRLADLYAASNRQRVPALLMRAVGELLDFDSGQICVMGESIRPIGIYDDVPAEIHEANIDSYYAGAYLLDPYYQAGVGRIEPGLYRLREVAPPGFRQSEYFRLYFRESGMVDEVVSLTYLPDGLFIHTSYAIFHGSPPLRQKQIERVRLAQPLIDRILVEFWLEFGNRQSQPASRLSTELGAALDLFGASLLTEREGEIIRLYLKGHSTRSIAERLGISPHTVSMHRKNAYGKLDVCSQFELFHLFMDSIACFAATAPEDPLVQYLAPARAN